MGYYSEVGLCLNKVAHDNMLTELVKQDEPIQAEVHDLLATAQKYVANQGNDHEATLYHWAWLKWYCSYNEMKFIENFLKSLTDDDDAPDTEGQYRFVRIGEEYEDIEVHGSYCENPFEMDAGRGVYISDSHKPQEHTSKT